MPYLTHLAQCVNDFIIKITCGWNTGNVDTQRKARRIKLRAFAGHTHIRTACVMLFEGLPLNCALLLQCCASLYSWALTQFVVMQCFWCQSCSAVSLITRKCSWTRRTLLRNGTCGFFFHCVFLSALSLTSSFLFSNSAFPPHLAAPLRTPDMMDNRISPHSEWALELISTVPSLQRI